jgi:hypothetical protein
MLIVWSFVCHNFMRECISEPINPDPLFIIRNTFPFTLSLFSFLFIINFENTKIFPLLHFTNQNTTIISFTIYHCIAYYFSLHIPASYQIFSGVVVFAYLLLVLYTYTHLVSDNHLVRLRTQSKFIYFAGCLKKDRKSPCTHSSPRVRYKPSSHLRGENCASLCSTLYSWSLNLAEASVTGKQLLADSAPPFPISSTTDLWGRGGYLHQSRGFYFGSNFGLSWA